MITRNLSGEKIVQPGHQIGARGPGDCQAVIMMGAARTRVIANVANCRMGRQQRPIRACNGLQRLSAASRERQEQVVANLGRRGYGDGLLWSLCQNDMGVSTRPAERADSRKSLMRASRPGSQLGWEHQRGAV